MATVFEKLNLKDQGEILVVNPPESFESELASLTGVTVIRDASKVVVLHGHSYSSPSRTS